MIGIKGPVPTAPTATLPPVRRNSLILESSELSTTLARLPSPAPPATRFIPSRHLPHVHRTLPSTLALLSALASLKKLYTSRICGVRVAEDDLEADDDDDAFERKWASGWLTRLVARGEEWVGELEGKDGQEEERREREKVVEGAAAVLACVAGMSASGSLDRLFTFPRPSPLPPLPITLHDATISSHKTVGQQTWGAAIILSRLIAFDPPAYDVVPGTRILEVGAGTGLVSCVAAKSLLERDGGLKGGEIVATDYLEEVLENLRGNVRRNFEGEEVTIRFLDWAEPPKDLQPFDTILGADIVYDPHHSRLLHTCCSALLRRPSPTHPNPTFHLCIALRPTHVGEVESVREVFARAPGQTGWTLEVVKEESLPYEKGTGRADEMGYKRFEIRWTEA